MVIERLSQEHRNIERLLTVLERELEVFDRGNRPDYEVIRAIPPMAGGSWASFGLSNNPDADYYPEAAQAPRSLSAQREAGQAARPNRS
jgi:hypothetical protein